MHKTRRQVRFAIPRQATNAEAGVRTITLDLSKLHCTAVAPLPTPPVQPPPTPPVVIASPRPAQNPQIRHGTTRYVNGVLQTSGAPPEKPPPPTTTQAASELSALKSCLKRNDRPAGAGASAFGTLEAAGKSTKPAGPSPRAIQAAHTVYLVPSKHLRSAEANDEPDVRAPPRRNRPSRTYQNATRSRLPNQLQVPLANSSPDDDDKDDGSPPYGDQQRLLLPTATTTTFTHLPAESSAAPPVRETFGQLLQLLNSWRNGCRVAAGGGGGVDVDDGRLNDGVPASMTSCSRRHIGNGGGGGDNGTGGGGNMLLRSAAPRRRSCDERPVHARVPKRSDDKSLSLNPRSWLTVCRTTRKPMPPVPTLLRAAREADEDLLRAVLRDILLNGIPSKDLNATDASGRTALSYICSTNLTHILDVFLQIPSVDINQADKEGNTPLHFAAQSGQSETVNMLLTRSRSISIDAKNHLGFTPLMKAALQGRTRCAKLLLFAGASPVVVDNGRGFRAEQWARFCSRYACAEMIETCARARLLDRGTSCQWAHDPHTLEKPTTSGRPRTAPAGGQQPPTQASATAESAAQSPASPAHSHSSPGHGIRSKLRKVFSFSLRDRLSMVSAAKKDRVQDHRTDFSRYFTATKLCSADSKSGMSMGGRQMEVPKLEVTPATNQSLIKKYEKLYGKDGTSSDADGSPQPSPQLPPRCKVRSRN